jgi:glycosyltransferase involved in cell wall biosynthesis
MKLETDFAHNLQKDHPLVSVVIPVYNRASTIQRSIESVLHQTYPVFEIIVVDDGSTDDTRDVVGSIMDKRIRLIRHQINSGVSSTRNDGMKEARGKYIAWLDSDDEWFPEKLNEQVLILESSSDNTAKACYTAFELEEKGRSLVIIPDLPDQKTLFLGCGLAAGSTLLFERQVLDQIGVLDEHFVRYEDWDWLLRYCRTYRLLGIGHPLARIHFTPHRSARIVESSANYFLEKYQVDLEHKGIFGKKAVAMRWMEVARFYAEEHNLHKTVLNLIKCLRIYPFHSPGAWILLFDSWFGTGLGSWLVKNMKKLRSLSNV